MNYSERKGIPIEDFDSSEYLVQKPCLVTFISLVFPRGYRGDRHIDRHRKTLQEIKDKSSSLFQERVDIDIFFIEKYIREISESGSKGVIQPVFELLRNYTHADVDAYIQGLETEGHKYGSFVFVITSYLPKYSLPTDLAFELYDVDMSLDYFINKMKSFESMALKPKIFLVQADNLDMPICEMHSGAGGAAPKTIVKKFPTDADCLIIFSTIHQRISTLPLDIFTIYPIPQSDQNTNASLVMQALIEILKLNPDKDLLLLTSSILGRVEEMIKEFKATHSSYQNIRFELPLFHTSLTKKVFLNKLVQQQ